MKFYDLYQILRTNEDADIINELGWDKAIATYPSIKAMMDINLKGSKAFEPEHKQYYTLVGSTKCDSLENVFETFNGYGEHFVKRHELMRSASVGDLIHDIEEDKWYIVNDFGFGQVEV